VQKSARRATPSFLLVGRGLLVCLVASGEGPGSRALFELCLVLARIVLFVVGFVRSVWSWLVPLERCMWLRFGCYCDVNFESFSILAFKRVL
jgi:hypothetical protein